MCDLDETPAETAMKISRMEAHEGLVRIRDLGNIYFASQSHIAEETLRYIAQNKNADFYVRVESALILNCAETQIRLICRIMSQYLQSKNKGIPYQVLASHCKHVCFKHDGIADSRNNTRNTLCDFTRKVSLRILHLDITSSKQNNEELKSIMKRNYAFCESTRGSSVYTFLLQSISKSKRWTHTYRLMSAFNSIQYNKNTAKDSTRPLSSQTTVKEYDDVSESVLVDAVLLYKNPDRMNVAAEAADYLLRLDVPEYTVLAESVIDYLSGDKRFYFTNAQNVHSKPIDESTSNCIDKLFELVSGACSASIEETVAELVSEFKERSLRVEDIDESLTRILYDTTRTGKRQVSLSTLLCKIWVYINTRLSDTERDTAVLRLYEELGDSVGLCSSGFASRLVNALSGISEFSVGIDYKTQVGTYVALELQKRGYAHFGEKFVLPETESGIQDENINMFIRTHLGEIRNTILDEFKQYIAIDEFNDYFHSAISSIIYS